MKALSTFLIIFPFTSILWAQTFVNKGVVQGTIMSSDNQPAQQVTVWLEGTSQRTTTNKKGFFLLKAPEGSYILKINTLGFETKEQSIEIKPDKTTLVNVTLNESSEQLQEITINIQRNPVTNKESEYIARMPLKNIENPQSYSIASKELIRQQGATDFQSALRAIPGASNATQDSYQFSVLYLRGFVTRAFYRNGLSAWSTTAGDPQVLERLELIKGPAGALFGGSLSFISPNYGGIINKVTKKPFNGKLYEAGISLGNFGLSRIIADINTPLDQDIYFRLNTAYQLDPHWQDSRIQNLSFAFAPSIAYEINPRLKIKLDVEINANRQPSSWLFSTANLNNTSVLSIKDIKLNYNRFYGDQNLTHDPVLQNFYAFELVYEISNNWEVSLDVNRTDVIQRAGTVNPYFLKDSLGVLIDTLIGRDVFDQDFRFNVTTIQPNIRGNFKIGPFANKLLIGFNYQNFVAQQEGFFYNGPADTISLNNNGVAKLNVNRVRNNFPILFNDRQLTNTYGFYVSDVINFTSRLNLLASLRYDYYRDELGGNFNKFTGQSTTNPFGQGFFAPKLGATYQIIQEQATIFANYATGFRNISPNRTKVFTPERSSQLEGGVKFEMFDKKVSSTASYYNIIVKDVVIPDPNNQTESIQEGLRTSEGIDLEFLTNFENLSIIAGYGYNKSVFEKSSSEIQGRRPAGVSEHIGNIWTTYTISSGKAKGLGFGGGVNYNSQAHFDDRNTISIPEYAVLNGAIFYTLTKLRLAINLNNINNIQYWSFNVLPQKPRNILVSATVKI